MPAGVSGPETLESIFEIPRYRFFDWGFTLPKSSYPGLTRLFGLNDAKRNVPVKLLIDNREYDAKIGLVRITSPKYPNRDVIHLYYDGEQETQKALRKTFMYSYASTIEKGQSDLKELMELVHLGGNRFRVKPIGRQKTDFDRMFRFLEDKNLFSYYKDFRKRRGKESFFKGNSGKWLNVSELKRNKDRINVVYLLYHSKNKQLYVGKANRLGDRVKKGEGRIGLADDWDKFMFFELNPDYNAFVEQIEAFLIRSFASIMENDVRVSPLKENGIKLVNKQLISK